MTFCRILDGGTFGNSEAESDVIGRFPQKLYSLLITSKDTKDKHTQT
jgi:hypothetical protein